MWLNKLSQLWMSRPATGRGSKAQAKRRHRVQLALEQLEDRTVLSTLTVLNNLDDGAGSLRDAIHAAHSDDTIVFSPSLAGQTITLTSGDLAIEKDLDIEGPGASLLAVSGNDSSRVFTIRNSASVIIAGLTITHGRVTGNGHTESHHGGAGILNVGGTLILSADVLSYNQALGSDKDSWFGGGAVFSAQRAHLTVTDSTFVNNLVVGSSGGYGGAIVNLDSTATIARSTFIDNRARGLDGGKVVAGLPDVGVGQGGAITNTGDSVMTVEDSTFTGNQAIGGNGGDAGPGASFSWTGLGLGGAISNQHDSVLTLRRSTLTGNQAIGGSGITGGRRGQNSLGEAIGGGLFNAGTVEASDTIFDRNEARGGNANTAGNPLDLVSWARGGAIHSAGGVFGGEGILIVKNSIFTGNRAIGGRGSAQGSGGLALGGAISVYNFSASVPATVSVIGSVLTGNLAVGGHGGAGGNGGNAFGGAILMDGGFGESRLTVLGSTITGNNATGGAAGAGGSAGQGVGGGAYFGSGSIVCFDAFTRDHAKHNHASTTDDDIFGVFTICP